MPRLLLPLLCGLLQVPVLTVSTGTPSHPAVWASTVSGLLGLSAGLLLFARHRAPLLVLGAAAAGQVAQVLLARPVVPVVTAVAVYVVARDVLLPDASPGRPVLALAGAVTAAAASIALAGHSGLAAPYALLLVLALLAGLALAVRTSRAATRRQEVVVGERLRIARDLHDTVGHGVGAITVQAGAARMAVAAGAAEDATRALYAIEDAGRSVLRDVRWMVGLLREDQRRRTLWDIDDLVDGARRSGLDVSLRRDGDLPDPSEEVAEAAYRIVQEAVTNVLRHSAARVVRVRVSAGPEVELEIHDPGPPRAPERTGPAEPPASGLPAASVPPAVAPGHGLAGMRERAAALGGRVDAGPDPDGGWSVRARMPARGRSR